MEIEKSTEKHQFIDNISKLGGALRIVTPNSESSFEYFASGFCSPGDRCRPDDHCSPDDRCRPDEHCSPDDRCRPDDHCSPDDRCRPEDHCRPDEHCNPDDDCGPDR